MPCSTKNGWPATSSSTVPWPTVLPPWRKILVTIGWTFWLAAAPPPPDPPMAVGLNSFGGPTTASPRTVVVRTVCCTGSVSSVRAGGLVCAACSAGDLI